MKRPVLAAPFLLVSLFGCPSDADDGLTTDRDAGVVRDGGSTVDGGPETVGEAIARIVCEREQECCPGNASNCRVLTTILDDRLERDGVVANQQKVDECFDSLRNTDCTTVAQYAGRLPFRIFCGDISTGTLPNGSACGGLFGDEQCASTRCTDGTCQALGRENEACSPGECEATLKCHSQVCVRPTAAGAVCENLSVCEDGYDCFRMAGETDARCHAEQTIAVGQTCEQGTVCELGREECWCPVDMTGCSVGLCGNSSRCRP